MEPLQVVAIVATFLRLELAEAKTFEDSRDRRLLLSDPSHWQQDILTIQTQLQAHTAEIQTLKSENAVLRSTNIALESRIHQVESSQNTMSNSFYFRIHRPSSVFTFSTFQKRLTQFLQILTES